MDAPLKFFVDPAWRHKRVAHTPLLYHLWGNSFSDAQPLTKAIFDTYPFDTSIYTIVFDSSQADVVLLPYRYEVALSHQKLLDSVIVCAQTAGLPILIDATGDTDYVIEIPRSIVLKWGGYRTTKRENEIIVPPYADDLLERYCNGKLSAREKGEVPIVGFAGRATLPPTQALRGFLKALPTTMRALFNPEARREVRGMVVRKRALGYLQKSNQVYMNLLSRTTYSANIKTAEGKPATLMQEFVDNALASDFGLDVRGDANASTRLFELLSLGRVPLIIDTDRNLPFSDELTYEEFSVIVPIGDLPHVADIVRKKYDSLSPGEWKEMQEKARAAYREWFRPDVLTQHVIHAIREKSRRN